MRGPTTLPLVCWSIYKPMNTTKEQRSRCDGWDGPCERMDATRQRQNTKYVEDERNWVTLCPQCMKANDAYWADMWADLYGGCL